MQAYIPVFERPMLKDPRFQSNNHAKVQSYLKREDEEKGRRRGWRRRRKKQVLKVWTHLLWLEASHWGLFPKLQNWSSLIDFNYLKTMLRG